jgi:outer membrane murein-binding lipoprotein Lpp
MKTTTLLTLIAALVFGLNGCTDAEMAQIQEASQEAANDNANMVQMENDCKNYMAEKIPELPMAAFSISRGYGSNGRYTIPVSINWDEPRVEESGHCTVVNGIVRNYIRTSD